MNEDMRTAEKFMQAVNAMKNALDTDGLEKSIDLELAARHNLRRKLRMIKAMEKLYRYIHGNVPKPRQLPSEAFNPFEGPERTNLHYLIEAMASVPPWELHKEILVVPTATTLLMLEIAAKLFPGPEIYRLTLLCEEFINRWTLPKFRSEWEDDEIERQVTRYRNDMLAFEDRFKRAYAEVSGFFAELEDPNKNPVTKKIHETHGHTKALAEKYCGKEPTASFVAQTKALNLWKEYKGSPEVKNKYCRKRHRLSYADIFDYCKREVKELGFKTAAQFEKAVKSALKRDRMPTKGKRK